MCGVRNASCCNGRAVFDFSGVPPRSWRSQEAQVPFSATAHGRGFADGLHRSVAASAMLYKSLALLLGLLSQSDAFMLAPPQGAVAACRSPAAAIDSTPSVESEPRAVELQIPGLPACHRGPGLFAAALHFNTATDPCCPLLPRPQWLTTCRRRQQRNTIRTGRRRAGHLTSSASRRPTPPCRTFRG